MMETNSNSLHLTPQAFTKEVSSSQAEKAKSADKSSKAENSGTINECFQKNAENAQKVETNLNKRLGSSKISLLPQDYKGKPLAKSISANQQKAIDKQINPQKRDLEKTIDKMRLKNLQTEVAKTHASTTNKVQLQPLLAKQTFNPVVKAQAFYIPVSGIKMELEHVKSELQSGNFTIEELAKKNEALTELQKGMNSPNACYDKHEVLRQLRTQMDLSLPEIKVGSNEDPWVSNRTDSEMPEVNSGERADAIYECIKKIKEQSDQHLSKAELKELGALKFLNENKLNPLMSSLEFTAVDFKSLQDILPMSFDVLKTGAENARELLAGKLLPALDLDRFILTKHAVDLPGASIEGSEDSQTIASRYFEGSQDFDEGPREYAWNRMCLAKNEIAIIEFQLANRPKAITDKINTLKAKLENINKEEEKLRAEVDRITNGGDEKVNAEMKEYSAIQAEIGLCDEKITEIYDRAEDLKSQLQSLPEFESQLADRIETLDENKEAIEELEEKIADLQDEIKEGNDEIDTLKKEIEGIEKETEGLDDNSEALGEKKDELEEKQEEVEEKLTELENKTGKIQKYENKIAAKKEENIHLNQELDGIDPKANSLLNSLNELQKEMEPLFKEKESLESKIDVYRYSNPMDTATSVYRNKVTDIIYDIRPNIENELFDLNADESQLGKYKEEYIKSAEILKVGSGETVRGQALIDCLFCSSDSHSAQFRIKGEDIYNVDLSRFMPPSETINSMHGHKLQFRSYFFEHPQTREPFSSAEKNKILSWDIGKIESNWKAENLIGSKEEFDKDFKTLTDLNEAIKNEPDSAKAEELIKQFKEIRMKCMKQIHPQGFEDFKNRCLALQEYVRECEVNGREPNLHEAFSKMYPLTAVFMKVYERLEVYSGEAIHMKHLNTIIEAAEDQKLATKEEIAEMKTNAKILLAKSGEPQQFWMVSSQVQSPDEVHT